MAFSLEAPSWLYDSVIRPGVVSLLRGVLQLLGPLRIRQAERIPRSGGLLILANHVSDGDPVVVQCACPRPIRFMSKAELFGVPVLGTLLRYSRAFPVKRGEPDRAALKYAAELLRAGECVCVFPEGQLSEDGELQELKPGVALIAKLAGVPLICVGLRGTDRIVPYGSVIPRPALGYVDVNWGLPYTIEPGTDAKTVMAWAERDLRDLSGQREMSPVSRYG